MNGKKISNIFALVGVTSIAIIMFASITYLASEKGSVVSQIADVVGGCSLITFFAIGMLFTAAGSRGISSIENLLHKWVLGILVYASGFFAGTVSFGFIAMNIIVKIQGVQSIRELSFYGSGSTALVFAIGISVFLIAKQVSKKVNIACN